MNKHTAIRRQWLRLVSAVLLLSACEDSSNRGLSALRLPPCSAEGSIFADTHYDDWSELYHTQVDDVIEAHMEAMNESDTKPLQCTKADQNALVPASGDLKKTAEMLPAWKDRVGDLKESNMQVVLLEFLRVYECSMEEQSLFIPVRLQTIVTNPIQTSGQLNELQTKTRHEINHEKVLARESLSRTLSLISGFERLQPLMLDIECLKRSSLDLRNALGLTSDVSSCLPRIWDAKGSLRDLEDL